MNNVETGDIFLLKNSSIFSNVWSFVTGSRTNHCGIAVRVNYEKFSKGELEFNSDGELCILELSPSEVISNQIRTHGVTIYPVKELYRTRALYHRKVQKPENVVELLNIFYHKNKLTDYGLDWSHAVDIFFNTGTPQGEYCVSFVIKWLFELDYTLKNTPRSSIQLQYPDYLLLDYSTNYPLAEQSVIYNNFNQELVYTLIWFFLIILIVLMFVYILYRVNSRKGR